MKKISFSIISLSLIGTVFTGCTKKCDMPATVKVNAGADQTILLPVSSATLTGTVTSGATPNTTYSWSEISGPNAATLTNNTTTTSTASNLVVGNYLFQFQATNNAGNTGLDTVSVTVNYAGSKTIIIQPGITTGQDAELISIPGWYTGNELTGANPADTLLRISDWTYYAQGYGEGIIRSFLQFKALDTLPAGSVILSATLSLTGINSSYPGWIGNSIYPGSPYNTYDSNNVWLQRATASWDQATITYNNQPAVTTTDEVEIPSSTSQYSYDVTNLDVTQLVKDMVAAPGTNHGFCMRLENETTYRQMAFYRANSSDSAAKSPKLIVSYK